MKNLPFISLLFFSLIYFSSCCKPKKLTEEKFFGQVYITATNANPVGIIEMKTEHSDVTNDIPLFIYNKADVKSDNNLRPRSRVSFEVYKECDYYIAKNVSTVKFDEYDDTDITSLYRKYKSVFSLNLHNKELRGDDNNSHRPKHSVLVKEDGLPKRTNGFYNAERRDDPNDPGPELLLEQLPPNYVDSAQYYYYYVDQYEDDNGNTWDIFNIDVEHNH